MINMSSNSSKIENAYLKLLSTGIKVDFANICETGLIGYTPDHGGRLWRKTSDFQLFIKPIVSHSQEQLEALYNTQYERIEKELGLV